MASNTDYSATLTQREIVIRVPLSSLQEHVDAICDDDTKVRSRKFLGQLIVDRINEDVGADDNPLERMLGEMLLEAIESGSEESLKAFRFPKEDE